MRLKKTDVFSIDVMKESKKILVRYFEGDCDTYTYASFKKFKFTEVEVLERTEHLSNEDIKFILKKLDI